MFNCCFLWVSLTLSESVDDLFFLLLLLLLLSLMCRSMRKSFYGNYLWKVLLLLFSSSSLCWSLLSLNSTQKSLSCSLCERRQTHLWEMKVKACERGKRCIRSRKQMEFQCPKISSCPSSHARAYTLSVILCMPLSIRYCTFLVPSPFICDAIDFHPLIFIDDNRRVEKSILFFAWYVRCLFVCHAFVTPSLIQ